MKNLLLTFCFILIAVTSYGQALNEGFEGETFPPEGWTVKSSGDIYKWKSIPYTDNGLKNLSGFVQGGENAALSITGYLSVDYGRSNPDSWLITPKITVNNGDILNFMMGYASSYNGMATIPDEAKIKFEVAVSSTGTDEANFETVILSILPQSTDNWNNYSVDLSRFAGQEIYIAFHDYGTPQAFPMLINSLYLDNIVINQVKASDLSVIAVDSPISSCETEQVVKATVRNVGYDVESYKMNYQVGNNPVVTEMVNEVLAGGDQREYTFQTPATLRSGNEYEIKVWVESDADVNHDNDAQTVSIAIGDEIDYPFTMTDDNAETAFMSTTTGGTGWHYYNDELKGWCWTLTYNASYLMSSCISLPKGTVKILFDYRTLVEADLEVYLVKDFSELTLSGTGNLAVSPAYSSTSMSIDVPEAGLYTLAIKPAVTYMGQLFLDNIQIKDPYDDVTVLSIDSPALNATLAKDNVELKATFKNIGNKDLTNIAVYYQLDNGTKVEETIASMTVGESVEYTFKTGKIDLSAVGMHTLTVGTKLPTDGDPGNDSKSLTISSYEAQAFPYKESFEITENNSNWIISNPDNDVVYWELMQVIDGQVNYAKDGVNAAYISSLAGTEHNDWLISPAINTPKGNARISFYYLTRMSSASAVDGCNIKVYLTKTDQPDEIKKGEPLCVATLTNANLLNYKQGYVSVDVQEAGNYYLAFYNDGQGHDIILDDIRFDKDEDMCMITATNSAETGFNLTENTVTLKVANHGTTVRSNLPLSYTVNDGKEITETYVGDIAPGDTVTHTFTTKVDISANNTYIIKVAVKDPDDIDAYNNSWVAPVIINYENGSIPYQCDFETDLERLYWIFGGTWATGNNFSSSRSAYSGTGAIYHSGSAMNPDGDWAYSGCIDIEAGTYDFSFFYRTFLNMIDPEVYGQDFEIFLGTAPDSESMTISVYKAEKSIVSTKQYKKICKSISLNQSGKYYIGVKCSSTTTAGNFYMDLFSITKPVTTGMELGTYEADFANREDEWYHYNPSRAFQQWAQVSEGDATFMQTNRAAYSYMDIPTELPGVYVAPVFQCRKGDEIYVSFDYQLSIDYPENLEEEEVAKINIGMYMAREDMPESFTETIAIGKVISEDKQTATGMVTIQEDGLYYFGFIADGQKKAAKGTVITTYNLYSAKIWNTNPPQSISQEYMNGTYIFSDNVLSILKEYSVARVYTVNGMLVGNYSGTDKIDMDTMSKGLYILSIVTDDGIVTGKVYVK